VPSLSVGAVGKVVWKSFVIASAARVLLPLPVTHSLHGGRASRGRPGAWPEVEGLRRHQAVPQADPSGESPSRSAYEGGVCLGRQRRLRGGCRATASRCSGQSPPVSPPTWPSVAGQRKQMAARRSRRSCCVARRDGRSYGGYMRCWRPTAVPAAQGQAMGTWSACALVAIGCVVAGCSGAVDSGAVNVLEAGASADATAREPQSRDASTALDATGDSTPMPMADAARGDSREDSSASDVVDASDTSADAARDALVDAGALDSTVTDSGPTHVDSGAIDSTASDSTSPADVTSDGSTDANEWADGSVCADIETVDGEACCSVGRYLVQCEDVTPSGTSGEYCAGDNPMGCPHWQGGGGCTNLCHPDEFGLACDFNPLFDAATRCVGPQTPQCRLVGADPGGGGFFCCSCGM